MSRFIMREYLTDEQKIKFDDLDDTQLYEVIEDRQGGDFAMDCQQTIKEWVDTALAWIDSDDCLAEDQVFINSLLEGGEHAIQEIDDFWDITFAKVGA